MRKQPLLERLRAKKRNRSFVAGVTWYTEETWAQVKASAADPDLFEASFPEWEAMATTALGELRNAGVNVVEYLIIPQEFFEWCALNNQVNNASSRAEFVSRKIKETHEPGT